MPDRFPLDLIWPRAETMDALKEHFGTDSQEEVFRSLGVDFRWIPVPVTYPDFERRINGTLGGVAPGAGRPYVFHDERTFEDHWGVIFRVGEDGKYLEWRGGPLVGREDLADWEPPRTIYPDIPSIAANLQPFRDYVTVTEIEFPFKIAWHISGYQHFMIQMAVNSGFVEALYDHLYAFQTEKAVLAAKSGYDIVALVGDIAGQRGLMYSTEMFCRYDLPRFTRLIASVRKANPSTKILYHSDGDLEEAIPALIECGIDILNPIQSACLDPAAVKERYGEKLTFHGTISVQDTIPNGTVQDVREEVILRMNTVGRNGGFIVSPENSIPFDAPIENVLAVYDTVRNYDYSTLRRLSPKRF
jgi:hypothetical protein